MQDLYPQQTFINNYLQQSPSDLSSHAFVNLVIWQDFFDYTFENIQGNLCVFAQDQAGMFMYWPPLGKTIHPKTITTCFEKMFAVNKGQGVSRIEHVIASQLAHFPRAHYRVFEKGPEYVYDRQRLIDLKGRGYKSKRNAYNYFLKHYAARCIPFEDNHREACLALFDRWAEVKKQQPREEMFLYLLEDNRVVHERVMREYQRLPLVGRVMIVEDQIVGYTFGYFLRPDCFCDFIEIADPKVKGAAVYLFEALCRDDALAGVKTINAMDDFALENLKKVKGSFRPSYVIPSYVVSPQDSNEN